MEFKFVQMKGPTLFQGYSEIAKIHWQIFKYSFPEPLNQFQPSYAQSILGWREFKFGQMMGPEPFQGEIITKKRKYIVEI